LSVLLYPAAEWNLEEFMATVRENDDISKKFALLHFFGCLATTLSHIHTLSSPIKHMDIKPKNLLVRSCQGSFLQYTIYVADFGISRSYESPEDSETHSVLTAFTRAYAAPEVALDDPRGLPADVFSLGCVFVEMLATICGAFSSCWNQLHDVRETHEDGDTSYFQNIPALTDFLEIYLPANNSCQIPERGDAFPSHILRIDSPMDDNRNIVQKYPKEISFVLFRTTAMLQFDPTLRPTAPKLAEDVHWIGQLGCQQCNNGPEPFAATQNDDSAPPSS
jgi:serine/threonine protein kinase